MRWILASFLIGITSAPGKGTDYLAGLPAFKEAINREIAAGNISGVSVGLVEGNRILYVDGFGFADKKKRIPATRDTVYRAGSISKLFTALAAMQQAERGRLSIDQPVTELWPDFRIVIPFPTAKAITLRQLMCHRAGMFRESPVGSYFDASGADLRATVLSIEACVLVYPPETRTKYSNIGVAVVGHTVGTVAGLPFQDYARELLLRWPGRVAPAAPAAGDQGAQQAVVPPRRGSLFNRPKVELLWDSPAAVGHNRQIVMRTPLATEGDRVAVLALDAALKQIV